MTTIKRYVPGLGAYPSEDGVFMYYSDHVAAVRELVEALRAFVDDIPGNESRYYHEEKAARALIAKYEGTK